MSPSPSLPELSSEERELLEAAGWLDPADLAGADPVELHAELEKANRILRLAEVTPALERVEFLVARAVELRGGAVAKRAVATPAVGVRRDAKVARPKPSAEPAAEEVRFVNYEASADMAAMLRHSPVAIPLPNRALAEAGIAPGEIAEAALLDHVRSDLQLRVRPRQRKRPRRVRRGAESDAGTEPEPVEESELPKEVADMRLRSLDDIRRMPQPSRRERRAMLDERTALIRAPRAETNRGKNPNSRRYIRGVLHDRPYRVWFGCLIVLLFQLAVPLAVASAPLLLLADSRPDDFEWVSRWWIAFPLAVPVLGMLYLIVSTRVKCRVCAQKVLVPRHCRKNKKAHHIPGLGHILPLAMHTLLFRWFTCTFCGTAVRIKE